MTEHEFIEEIDCAFPYVDPVRSMELIKRGIGISPNAAFMVLHELCRPPKSKSMKVELLDKLICVWQTHFDHPLVPVVMPAVRALVEGYDLEVSDALAAMKSVSQYPNQFNALAIPYFACDDVAGAAETLYQQITSRWSEITSQPMVLNDKDPL